MTNPLDLLFEQHRSHYEAGTLDRFVSWFQRTGCGDMLANPYLGAGGGRRTVVDGNALKFSDFSGLSFINRSAAVQRLSFIPVLDRNADTVEALFENFVRCTAHTHPIADFRLHLRYFTSVLSGPRFLLCHGAGSCLLLGAMFQSFVSQRLDERVDLHYSHAANMEFTHVFGTWRDKYFVDPDQKTWSKVDEIDDVPSLGYIFQQLGVAGHLLYRGLTETERSYLFAEMTRDYFKFYDHSVRQYMYSPRQEVAELARLFHEARTKFRSPFSIDASDYDWKDQLRRQAKEQGINSPVLLSGSSQAAVIELPPQGALRIGIGEDDLPEEAAILAAIFFGRTPAVISVTLREGRAEQIRIPDFPWFLAFDCPVEQVSVNGRGVSTRRSRCGRFFMVGMSELERAFDLAGGHADYSISVVAPGASRVKIVLPINAFALSSDLIRFEAANDDQISIEGRVCG
jgi:hypothetical protein